MLVIRTVLNTRKILTKIMIKGEIISNTNKKRERVTTKETKTKNNKMIKQKKRNLTIKVQDIRKVQLVLKKNTNQEIKDHKEIVQEKKKNMFTKRILLKKNTFRNKFSSSNLNSLNNLSNLKVHSKLSKLSNNNSSPHNNNSNSHKSNHLNPSLKKIRVIGIEEIAAEIRKKNFLKAFDFTNTQNTYKSFFYI